MDPTPTFPKPFGPEYQRRSGPNGSGVNGDSCCLCGRPTKPGSRSWVTVVDGGASFGTREATQDAGYMGGFVVGPRCAKRLRAHGVEALSDENTHHGEQQ